MHISGLYFTQTAKGPLAGYCQCLKATKSFKQQQPEAFCVVHTTFTILWIHFLYDANNVKNQKEKILNREEQQSGKELPSYGLARSPLILEGDGLFLRSILRQVRCYVCLIFYIGQYKGHKVYEVWIFFKSKNMNIWHQPCRT